MTTNQIPPDALKRICKAAYAAKTYPIWGLPKILDELTPDDIKLMEAILDE